MHFTEEYVQKNLDQILGMAKVAVKFFPGSVDDNIVAVVEEVSKNTWFVPVLTWLLNLAVHQLGFEGRVVGASLAEVKPVDFMEILKKLNA